LSYGKREKSIAAGGRGGFYLSALSFPYPTFCGGSMRVQVEYFGTYNMPSGCVACGDPIAPHLYSVGTSNWSGKQSVSLKFPLCEECNQVEKMVRSASWAGCLGSLLLMAIGAALGSGLNAIIHGDGLQIVGGTLGLVAGFIVGRILALNSKTPEQRKRIDQVNKSVRMLGFNLPTLFGKGWIKLEFANDKYGMQFMLLNGGKV
jgi:hypothetical protein